MGLKTRITGAVCSVAVIIGLSVQLYPDKLRSSPEGQALIGNEEGCRRDPYCDGVGVLTVGMGSTGHVENRRYSDEEIAARWVKDVASAEDCVTGEVGQLINVALTNLPALEELDEGVIAAASRLAATSSTVPENTAMDEEQIAYLLSQLRWILNLPETSTAADIKTELEKIITAISGGQGMAAASVDLLAMLTTAADRDARIAEQAAQIADLSQRVYDPAKFVPVAALSQVQEQYAQTITESGSQEVEQLITAALSDRRLLPGELETWARDLGQKDPAALKAYLEKAPPMAALNRMQTQEVPGAPGGTPRSADPRNEGKNPAALDPVLVALSQQFGNDPAEMARLMEE
ncbi:hypothetical protein QQI03_002589 [Salmonella enterica]|nr:hypothetical protein [Salmonella enterica]